MESRVTIAAMEVEPQTNIDLDNETLFLKLPRRIMSFLGIWIFPDRNLLLHYLNMLLITMSQFIFLLFQIIYAYNVLDDIDKLSEAFYLLFSAASLLYKTMVFVVNLKNLRTLLSLMGKDIFVAKNCEEQECLNIQARKIGRFCALYVTSAMSATALLLVTPLFNLENRTFPFKIWMPVRTDKSPDYEMGYLYQAVHMFVNSAIYAAVDAIIISMIMFACAELEIIMNKLEKLQNVPLSAKLKPNERTQLLNSNYESFVACIKHHQTVIEYIDIVERSFHTIIFFQFAGTVIVICTTGIRIMNISKDSAEFFSMSNYMLTILSQLFLYCWCGNELTIRSENIREVMYQCPWFEQETKFKRTLWIAMERMKKPIVFRAGYFISLSRQTFVAILRSSYSYFAVLNQVTDEKSL